MHKIDSIRQVEIELSSFCNASCPLCSRNFFGFNSKELGYEVKHLSLDEIKTIFNPIFIKQLHRILLQGNFGDFAMNSETPKIVKYLLECNPNLDIRGYTNGGVQSASWWKQLKDITIFFALDGIDSATHNLYRKDTNFNKVIENAKSFKEAGGVAVWHMIEFDHNQHQIQACKKAANDLGFRFISIKNSKSLGPVFDQNRIYIHNIGNYKGSKNIEELMSYDIVFEDIEVPSISAINCESVNIKGIYVSSTGEVFPCCYMAHATGSYGKLSTWAGVFNQQLNPLIEKNNALEYGLECAIDWFENIKPTWTIDSFKEGRLLYCGSNCAK